MQASEIQDVLFLSHVLSDYGTEVDEAEAIARLVDWRNRGLTEPAVKAVPKTKRGKAIEPTPDPSDDEPGF